jgi:hypothetical protein
MKARPDADWWIIAPVAAATAFFTVRALSPQTWASLGITDVASLRAASALKLLCLLVGGVIALRNAAQLGAGNAMRPGWLRLGMGLLATFVGQAVLAAYQFSPRGAAPFPSAADFFFFLSYPLFIAALVAFLAGYAAAGYALGSLRARLSLGALVAGIGLAVALPILRPVLVKAEVEPLARFLNAAYPLLDLVLLVPVVLVLRASLPLRGGQVWKVWVAILTGFLCMWAGDTLFAYFDALGVQSVDPLVHAMYLLSYGSLALAAERQRRLLAV